MISLCGDVYKLKAADAKNRQIWVNKLRLAAQEETVKAQSTSSMPSPGIMSQQTFSANSPLTSDLLQSLDSVRDQLLVVSFLIHVLILVNNNFCLYRHKRTKLH